MGCGTGALRNPPPWLRAFSALQPARPHERAARLPSQGSILSNSGRAGVQDVSERGLFRFRNSASRQSQIGWSMDPHSLLLGLTLASSLLGVGGLPRQSHRAGEAAHDLTAMVDGHRAIACSTWSRQPNDIQLRALTRGTHRCHFVHGCCHQRSQGLPEGTPSSAPRGGLPLHGPSPVGAPTRRFKRRSTCYGWRSAPCPPWSPGRACA